MRPQEAIKYLSGKFGKDWASCEEPESISLCLDIDTDLSDDMIDAIKTCLVSRLPWADPFVFENVVDGLSGNPVIPETLSVPPLEEICVAVDLMTALKPNLEFSNDVKKYICSCAMDYGLTWLPEILLFAADFMEEDPNGIQFMVKTYIEASGYPLFDYPYKDDPVGVQLQKLAAVEYAYMSLSRG
jgi:hypothetical protein